MGIWAAILSGIHDPQEIDAAFADWKARRKAAGAERASIPGGKLHKLGRLSEDRILAHESGLNLQRPIYTARTYRRDVFG